MVYVEPRLKAVAVGHALTEREHQILTDVMRGMTARQSAVRRELSLSTVKTHRANICRKFNARSIAQAVAVYLGNNDEEWSEDVAVMPDEVLSDLQTWADDVAGELKEFRRRLDPPSTRAFSVREGKLVAHLEEIEVSVSALRNRVVTLRGYAQ